MAIKTKKSNTHVLRDVIEIDEELCDGCGQCLSGCAEGALILENGKAKLISDTYCDGLGNCLGHCPTGALQIIRRPAHNFDVDAVLALANSNNNTEVVKPPSCPGSSPRTFLNTKPHPSGQAETFGKNAPALASWPIQLKLIPTEAAFLDCKVLVLAADCTAFTGPAFHEIFLTSNHPLIIACPKLDDLEEYIDKLTLILKAHPLIKEIRIPMMSLPCCGGLGYMATQALKKAGRECGDNQIALRTWIITPQGDITEEHIR